MRIISFAWTTEALLMGLKTVTRRKWKDSYALKFKEGDLVAAYDKVPYAGGKKIATLRLTCDPYKEPLFKMTDKEEINEGSLWGSAEQFIIAMCVGHKCFPKEEFWVIRFEVVEVTNANKN